MSFLALIRCICQKKSGVNVVYFLSQIEVAQPHPINYPPYSTDLRIFLALCCIHQENTGLELVSEKD